MDASTIVNLVKERLGIRTTVRDSYLESIVKSVITELEDEKGLTLDAENFNHLLFVLTMLHGGISPGMNPGLCRVISNSDYTI